MEPAIEQVGEGISTAYYAYMALGGGVALANYAKAKLEDEKDLGYAKETIERAESYEEEAAEIGSEIEDRLEGEYGLEEVMSKLGKPAYVARHPWRSGKTTGYLF